MAAAAAALLSRGLPAGAAAAGPRPIDFDHDIRPILSENCFACHGPDEQQRKAKLRLDRKDDAFKALKSGDFAIVPGDVKKSQLLARVTAKDPDDIMPPTKTGKKLTPQQIELLTQWVGQGAHWQTHWSLIKPERPAVPPVKAKRWVRNEIDNFVVARLEQEGLTPSPEADKVTLIRRAAYDLTGLPPTPQEVDAFLADKDPEAYTQLVDRLLTSPRYGEQMARYWLDASRYADSHGYHIDSERSIWKWRDWVIDAFNQNLPFDKFTTYQLAGDLLPNATIEQKVASGYTRCNMSTGEGGAIEAEYQAKYTFDRTETTSTVWLGLTMTCCRCHTHKYDPITQREYYRMFAFFNNLDVPIMDGNRPNPDPFLKLPSPEQTERLAWLKKQIGEAQDKLDAPIPDLDHAQSAWAARWHEKLSAQWSVLEPARVTSTNGVTFRNLPDHSTLAEGANPAEDVQEAVLPLRAGTLAAVRLEALPDESLPEKSAARSEDGQFRLSTFEADLVTPVADGKPGEHHKLKFNQAVADAEVAGHEAGKAIDDKADTNWEVPSDVIAAPHAAVFALAEPAAAPAGAELHVTLHYSGSKLPRTIGRFRLAVAQDERLVQLLAPPKPEPWQLLGPLKAASLTAGLTNDYGPEKTVDLKQVFAGVREEAKWEKQPDFVDGKPHQLVDELHGVHGVYFLYRTVHVPSARKLDLSLRADDVFKVWLNGQPIAERATPEKPGEGPLKFTAELKAGDNAFLVKIVNQVGEARYTFNSGSEDADSVTPELAALLSAGAEPVGKEGKTLRSFYRLGHSPEQKHLSEQVAQWRDENTAVENAIPITLVAKESAERRKTFMLMRGEYDKPGDAVDPGVPSVLPPLPAGAPTNRLGLAEWLVDPSHPLTARVTVNRYWQQYFGVGLVKTVEDFGVQGERPSHPELLDWLATEFIQSGWNVKHLQRLIVTSGTYRQSSRVSPALLARDPENRLLARGPRFRMDAEVVRDTALEVSGLLIEKSGGHSVKPYQPPGLWEAVSYNNAQKYLPDTGEGQYRRTIYTYWKRQSPPPNLLLFDAPTREYCTVRRSRSNTPLQALVLLNDPQFVEAARAFAQRVLAGPSDRDRDRLTLAYRLAVARAPRAEELKLLLDILAQQRAEFRRDPAGAQKFLGVGSYKADGKVDDAELAAWTTITSMILNLDETITKG